MNRHEYFQKRLQELGVNDPDSDYDGMLGKSVSELSEVFAKQGHSGVSAVLTIDLFTQLFKEWEDPKNTWIRGMIALTIADKIMLSLPLVMGIAFCIYAMFIMSRGGQVLDRHRVSDLEELDNLSDDDYMMVSDMSEKKSVKVKLSTLKRFIKS